jgi:hypothetical protein
MTLLSFFFELESKGGEKLMQHVFVDPGGIGPRELDNTGMSDLSGGSTANVIAFATLCGEGLAVLMAAGIATALDP